MSYLNDAVLDAALDYIDDQVTQLFICSAEPATYAEASSAYALGSKSTPVIGEPEDGDVSGRKCTVATFSDGSVSASGIATHWALCSGTVLIAAGALSASQSVTSGNTFSLTAFDIEIPDAA